MFELITDDEKAMIDYSVWYYGHGQRDNLADLSYRLRFWESNKKNLFNLLGHNLILEKDTDASISTDELTNNIGKAYNNDSDIYNFVDLYARKINQLAHAEKLDYSVFRGLINLTIPATLASGICQVNIPKFVINDKELTIQGSAKVVKMLGRLAEILGIDKDVYENFRLKMSVLTNQNNIKGRLCLSIHPLDYITMSANESDWSSCMSWVDSGCYRAGTIEMMNSPYVLVAYLKSKTDMTISDYNWDNKKWRVLVIFDGEHAITIKDYPYYSAAMNNEVLEWIKELAHKNLGIELNNGIYTRSGAYDYDMPDGTRLKLNYHTEQMYNDFWSTTHHFIYTDSFKGCDLNYSGPKNCMICGDCVDGEFYDECETQIVCSDCLDLIYCDHCGELVGGGQTYEVDGERLCESCLERECYFINGEYHLVKNCSYVYLIPDNMFDENDKPLFSTTYGEFNYSYMRLFNGDICNPAYMNTADYKLHQFTMGNRDWGITRYAICPEALTRLGERSVC